MKLFKRKKDKIKTPWFSQYVNIRKELEIPDISLYEMIKKTTEKIPKSFAYTYFNNSVTYSTFNKNIINCAKALKNLGINKGEVVTICMPNTPEAITMFYAVNMIGCIADMIHPLSSEVEIINYINDSKSVAILTADLFWGKVSVAIKGSSIKNVIIASVSQSMDLVTSVGFWIKAGRKIKKVLNDDHIYNWIDFINLGINYKGEIDAKTDGSAIAAILHSGGTTGSPKGIILTNMNFNALALGEIEVFSCCKEGISVLSILPIFHGFGLATSIHAFYCMGGKTIIIPKFEVTKLDGLFKKYKPSVVLGVPTIFEGIINNKNIGKMDLSFIECILGGGDTITPVLREKVNNFLKERGSNATVRPAYGMTECISGVTVTPIHKYKDNTIGIPIPGTYIKIVKPSTQEEVPYGTEGEICISGSTVMKGYLNNPEETAQILQEHEDGRIWLHSGDLGSMDEEGFVFFNQRLKRMIVSSGYNIYPAHIEAIIKMHKDVLTATVIGIDHSYKVQVAKAFIVLKEGVEENHKIKKEIKELCEKNLPRYSLPYEYEFRKSLPTTLIGKVAFTELEKEEREKRGKK